MTKKDYELIASNIKYCTIRCNNNTRSIVNKQRLIRELCEDLKQDNNLFDKDKFVKACE